MIAVLLGILASLIGGGPAPVRMPVATPIGVGPRYQPPAAGPQAASRMPIRGLRCSRPAPRVGAAHVELFADGRAMLLPPGIGVGPPVVRSGVTILSGACVYPVRTLDPTGVVWLGRAHGLTLGSLFAVWGQPLGRTAVSDFRSRRPVRVYVDGALRRGDPAATPLADGAEVVVEIGRYVPPHSTYGFSGKVTT